MAWNDILLGEGEDAVVVGVEMQAMPGGGGVGIDDGAAGTGAGIPPVAGARVGGGGKRLVLGIYLCSFSQG